MLIKNYLKEQISPQVINFFQSKIQSNIQSKIKDAKQELKQSFKHFPKVKIQIAEEKFGDFSSSIALESSKLLKQKPIEVANLLKDAIFANAELNKVFKKIEIAGPGFINFYFSTDFQNKAIQEIIDRPLGDFIDLKNFKKKQKILLEYISANPTGPLHVGHGRWAVIGNVLAKILRATGNEVYEEFYINDTGHQIDKLLESVELIRNKQPIPEDGYHGEYLKVLPKDVNPVDFLLAQQKQVLISMGTHIQNFFSEKKIRETGKINEIIDFLKKQDFIYLQDGAWWFRSSRAGDDKDRVVIRSSGEITYFGVDIAYHFNKYERGYSLLIDVLGADHHGYVKRIQSAVAVMTQKKVQLDVIIGQLVSISRNGEPIKMSKRSGELIELKEVVEEIGVDAFRYFFSMRSPNTPLEFDLEIAKQKNINNPVFYVQYSHARIQSVFKKASELGISFALDFNFSYIENPWTRKILNHLLLFEEELLLISETYEIQYLNNYLYELSSLFHSYYNQEIFVSNKTPEEKKNSSHRLVLLLAVDKVIKEGLLLLGISSPDTM